VRRTDDRVGDVVEAEELESLRIVARGDLDVVTAGLE
jgi:hypothetical protein